MDRGKSSLGGRGGKSKIPQHPAEVYALGAKAGNEPTKRSVPVPHSKPGTSHSLSSDRKREGVIPPSSLLPPKKAKLAHSSTVVSGGIVRSTSVTSQDNSDAWEAYAVEFDPADFIPLISDASNAGDQDKVVGYICGAIKTLKQQRFKPDASLIQSLLYLSKIKCPVFTNEYIMSALCSVLRRDPNLAFKTKNALLPILATNLLMRAYQDSKRWPEIFVKLYIEDSLGERLWVDQECCKSFVDNILTAFSTKLAPAESRPELADDPESIALSGPSSAIAKEILEFIPVFNRFSMNQESVEATVLEIVRENLNRRQAPDNITRNFLKLLASAAGLVEVRVMAATRLEVWLQNPKLLRSAQELLMAVCVNCTGHTQKDVEVISALVKIRLKSKAVVNYYLACIRELIVAHSDNLATVLKHTIYNELSQSRNPNNLAMLSVMFQHEPDTAATILADIFQELLLNRDDYLRPLRALLREIWRTLRSDLNLAAFSRGLMSQTEPLPRDCEFSQRAFTATADLITLCMFLATATYARPDKKEPPPTNNKVQDELRKAESTVLKLKNKNQEFAQTTCQPEEKRDKEEVSLIQQFLQKISKINHELSKFKIAILKLMKKQQEFAEATCQPEKKKNEEEDSLNQQFFHQISKVNHELKKYEATILKLKKKQQKLADATCRPDEKKNEEEDHLTQQFFHQISIVHCGLRKFETTILKLKRKKQYFAEKTCQPHKHGEEDNSARHYKHQALAQKIYVENRRLAQKAYLEMEHLCPKIELPLYNQPSDAAVLQHPKNFRMIASKLNQKSICDFVQYNYLSKEKSETQASTSDATSLTDSILRSATNVATMRLPHKQLQKKILLANCSPPPAPTKTPSTSCNTVGTKDKNPSLSLWNTQLQLPLLTTSASEMNCKKCLVVDQVQRPQNRDRECEGTLDLVIEEPRIDHKTESSLQVPCDSITINRTASTHTDHNYHLSASLQLQSREPQNRDIESEGTLDLSIEKPRMDHKTEVSPPAPWTASTHIDHNYHQGASLQLQSRKPQNRDIESEGTFDLSIEKPRMDHKTEVSPPAPCDFAAEYWTASTHTDHNYHKGASAQLQSREPQNRDIESKGTLDLSIEKLWMDHKTEVSPPAPWTASTHTDHNYHQGASLQLQSRKPQNRHIESEGTFDLSIEKPRMDHKTEVSPPTPCDFVAEYWTASTHTDHNYHKGASAQLQSREPQNRDIESKGTLDLSIEKLRMDHKTEVSPPAPWTASTHTDHNYHKGASAQLQTKLSSGLLCLEGSTLTLHSTTTTLPTLYTKGSTQCHGSTTLLRLVTPPQATEKTTTGSITPDLLGSYSGSASSENYNSTSGSSNERPTPPAQGFNPSAYLVEQRQIIMNNHTCTSSQQIQGSASQQTNDKTVLHYKPHQAFIQRYDSKPPSPHYYPARHKPSFSRVEGAVEQPRRPIPHKDIKKSEKMQGTVAGIQNDAVWWLQETALRIYRPSATDFVHALHKVVLMEQADQYYKLDNWPPESDRLQFMRLASEVPLQQHTLLRVLMMGLSKEHPLSPAEALELADQLVRRAANIPSDGQNMLTVDKLEIFDLVFNLCAYHHPENIDLPAGYKPPTLAITNLYWKGWALLLVLAAHNPTTIGAVGWNKYPTLRLLMETCITNHFVFPAAPDELQILALEKEAILQFESHLAAASTKMEITEQTSLLLSQLTGMDVKGEARRPPPVVVEQLTLLNNQLRLGHQLCRCRQPDFLLDIIQHQGPSQSMPWLADLVHSSDASLSHLPVQCLCEFLLSSSARQQHKYQQLLSHLQSLLSEPSQDPEIVCEILDYFLRRLSSPRNREQAIAGLRLVLGCAEDEVEEGKDDASWLLKQLPLLPHFPEARPQIVVALRSACLVETDPQLVVTYLAFLAQHSSCDVTETTDLVADMATLIVERSTIINAIIPSQDTPNAGLDAFLSIFYSYLIKAREPQREAYTWSESQDQILVTWPSGEQCTLYILVVHAMVIILAFGPQCVTLAVEYQHLLDVWFPTDKQDTPKAFLVDTSEEALLIPDWLKLRMIRSRVPRLVDAALTDLEPQQLILFIQSFGIPVASMSKLLETLDRAVLTDEVSVVEAVQDKSYMIQLVEVQHQRGARGGEVFARALGVQETPRPAEPDLGDVTPMDISEMRPIDVPPAIQLTESKAIPVLENLFLMPETPTDRQMSRDIFLTLQKTISSEMSKCQTSKDPPRILKVLIIFLMKKTSSDKSFVRAIVSRPHFACPLFRLLTSVTRADLLPTVLLIASVVLSEAQKSPRAKPLAGILNSFIHRHRNRDLTLRAATTDNPKKVFEETPLSRLEVQGRILLEDHSLRVNDSQALVQSLSGALLQQTSDNRKGLLLDWLVQLEPEIIGETSTSQMDLLFSRGQFECRPFLLTLLTHHASWATLHHCTKRLLNPKAVAKYDPSAVLDFLIALTCNPKLLQGREKYTPKHGATEDILDLPGCQLPCIADYIVEEAIRFDDIKAAVDKMNQRLSLLAPHADKDTLSIVIRHLNENAAKPTGKRSEMCRQLLVQLYLRVPSIITQLSDTELSKYLSNSPISVMGSSVLDKESHTLLTALTATPPNKDWYRRSQEYDLATRKMTATHPLLVLRQLSMLAAALRGRVHLEFPVLRGRNHLALFTQALGLLELLKPHLFRAEYTRPLHSVFDTYFALFKQHGHMKDVGSLLVRFVSLLKAYIGCNAEEALRYLQTQASLISELQSQHHSLGSVCILVGGVREAGGGEVLVTVPPTPPQDTFPPQWDNVIAALKGPDVLASLHDLDHFTVRQPALLTPAVSALAELITAPGGDVRALAHGLLARHLRYAPHSAPRLLPAYLTALQGGQVEVVCSVLDRLHEVVVCSQEMAVPLLETVFSLGLTHNMNTLQCITKTLSLLNLQSGC